MLQGMMDEGGLYERDTTKLLKQDFTEMARNSREYGPQEMTLKGR